MKSSRNIAILGSTGSVGQSALEVLRTVKGLNLVGISGHSNLDLLAQQAAEFQPRYVVCTHHEGSRFNVPGLRNTRFLHGQDGLIELATDPEVDIVLAAIVGSAGVPSTWAAIECGKTVALANKETMVVAGELITQLARKTNATILPVDSEHSALFQCFTAGRMEEVERVVLTASGGPFREFDAAQLRLATREQALAHPTWDMGQKITIDSATMMNKALEVIEARWLFDLDPEKIEVVIHPQSIVHSFVEYRDGSVLAQLSPPCMKLPIQYALTYPDRIKGASPRIDWKHAMTLQFFPPDHDRFPALQLGFEVARSGGTAGAVLNAANEVAVESFLRGEIGFTDIALACREILDHHNFEPHPNWKQIQFADHWARGDVQVDVGVMFDSFLNFPILLLAEKPSFWLDPNSYWAIARVIMGLGLVIFIHELGHFLVAKACGVKCDKFYVGFDAFDIKIGDRVIIPRSLFKWQWGETEYGIGILPLGGYVKMMGQDDNPANYEKELERSRQGSADSQDDAKLAKVGMVDRSQLDSRSFLAKSVIQRIAIISAGVIFNLISAVFFAAIAFKSGVNFTPAQIGSTQGGSPAWEQKLAGADIKKIGDSETDDYFTWINLAEHFVFNNGEKPLPIRYIPFGETEVKSGEVLPRKNMLRKNEDLALAGVESRSVPIIGEDGVSEGSPASEAQPPFKAGDKIIKLSGVEVSTDLEMRSHFVREARNDVELTVERKSEPAKEGKSPPPEVVKIKVKPNPMRELGFSLNWLPIASIQKDSPAEKAGLKVGDEIIKVDGQPRGDLLKFNRRLLDMVREDKSVELEIRRGQSTQSLTIKPSFYLIPSSVGENQPFAIDAIGVAIPLGLVIESVTPGSSAAAVGLQEKDELKMVRFLLDEKAKEGRFKNLAKEPVNFVEDKTSWTEIDAFLQMMPVGSEIELTVSRLDSPSSRAKIVSNKLKTTQSDDFFLEVRGLLLTPLEKHYVSDSWSDAFRYGGIQVWRDIRKVGETLLKLVRGKISPKNLGGPGTIAMVATSEATEGNSRLLLFLTFLSANLAVVNLLPIPVLDGGHLLFLSYEGIFRRPVNEKTQIILTYVGLAMILALMIFVISLDIDRYFLG